MKIREISLQNFAKYDQVSVSFDDKITYLVGKNGSGKSTLGITAIWFMFQGIAEKASGGNNPLIGERFRFIGNNAATAKGEMTLYDEVKGFEVKVFRKLTKTGSDLSFQGPEGMVLDQKWLTDLFNIFLIAPKRFQELSPKEQARAIGIDTSKFDADLAELKKKFTEINAVFRSYGTLEPVEKAERVDITALQSKKNDGLYNYNLRRKEISDGLNQQYLANKAKNEQARNEWFEHCKKVDADILAFNNLQLANQKRYNDALQALTTLVTLGYDGQEAVRWVDLLKQDVKEFTTANYGTEPTYIPEIPEQANLNDINEDIKVFTANIDQEIQDANNANLKAVQYEEYLHKVAARNAKEKELSDNKAAQDKIESDRIAYIKAFDFPFNNLSVGDDGELLLSGKPIKEPYFSTGELLKMIPILISTRNPEFKYVFLQDFNLLDDGKQAEITEYLTGKGFQLVIEYVGQEAIIDKSCILLKDNVIVESYEEEMKATLL